MKLIKKIFHSFFLFKVFFITIFFLKIVLANNTNEANTSILKRLPTSIFATINNEPISIYDLIQRSNLFSVSANIPIDQQFEIRVLPDLISGYIDEIIQMQEIKKESIYIPEEQIQLMIEKVEKDNGFEKGKLKGFLKENKTDISILEKQVSVSIGWRQLVANKFRSQIVIQDAEVDVIHNNLTSNVGKEEFFIHQIFLSFENREKTEALNKMNNIYNQLAGGGNFVTIAKQFSESYTGKIGEVGWISEVELDQNLVSKVKDLEINNISKPLEGESGYFIIKVLDKRIIGEDVIKDVSLFRFKIIEKNDETQSLIKKINNCKELEEFSKEYASSESGSLGNLSFDELSGNLKKAIKELKVNEISDPVMFGSEDFQIMLCDINRIKPIIPSKFKIQEILINKKLDTISRQYMSELRSKAVIDVRI